MGINEAADKRPSFFTEEILKKILCSVFYYRVCMGFVWNKSNTTTWIYGQKLWIQTGRFLTYKLLTLTAVSLVEYNRLGSTFSLDNPSAEVVSTLKTRNFIWMLQWLLQGWSCGSSASHIATQCPLDAYQTFLVPPYRYPHRHEWPKMTHCRKGLDQWPFPYEVSCSAGSR